MNDNVHSKCQTLLGSLSDYIDGTLSEELCEEINRHISECQNCHIVVDTMRKTIFLYQESAANSDKVPGIVRERLFRTLNLDDYIKH